MNKTKPLPPGWEWVAELWSEENLNRVASAFGPVPDGQAIKRIYDSAVAHARNVYDDDILLQEAYDSGYRDALVSIPGPELLRKRIGAVIDRWYHLGLIRFNSHDDGGDDLILRDELLAAVRRPPA